MPENRIRVFPNQTAAWAAAAAGLGVAPAPAHLVSRRVARGELVVMDTPATPADFHWYVTTLRPDRRPPAAGSLRRFLSTPEAMQLMQSPDAGVPPVAVPSARLRDDLELSGTAAVYQSIDFSYTSWVTTTIKVSEPTRDRIKSIGASTRETADEVVARALDEYERVLFWRAFRVAAQAEAENGMPPEAAEEQALWDRALRDGLDDA